MMSRACRRIEYQEKLQQKTENICLDEIGKNLTAKIEDNLIWMSCKYFSLSFLLFDFLSTDVVKSNNLLASHILLHHEVGDHNRGWSGEWKTTIRPLSLASQCQDKQILRAGAIDFNDGM